MHGNRPCQTHSQRAEPRGGEQYDVCVPEQRKAVTTPAEAFGLINA